MTPQSYPREQVQAGQARFASQCGFCHGRDAAGGETGPDLTRSTLVAEDFAGDKIGPLVRAGRHGKGMPAFRSERHGSRSDRRLHPRSEDEGESLGGGRRSVDVVGSSDRATQDAGGSISTVREAVRSAIPPTGDLAGVSGVFRDCRCSSGCSIPRVAAPLPLLRRCTVTLPSGETDHGPLASATSLRSL